MDLIESINTEENVKGVTLNSQEIDLFNIIELSKSEEDAKKGVIEYLKKLFDARKRKDLKNMSIESKVQKIIGEKDTIDNKTKIDMMNFILSNQSQIAKLWRDKDALGSFIQSNGKDSRYLDIILDMRAYFEYQFEGILTFLVDKDGNTINPDKCDFDVVDIDKTFGKVKAIHSYITQKDENGKNRFNTLTLDSQGKFKSVAGNLTLAEEEHATPEDYSLDRLRDGYEFALRHGMDVRVNALVFYSDFPSRLVGAPKEAFETALINYGKAIASVVEEYEKKGVATYVDMFNELVDYYEPFSERTDTWNSKLSIEELCKIATTIKSYMPNANFCYNDWNFENGMKREAICRVLDKIAAYEKAHPEEGTILDHIGMQFHTSINDVEGAKQSIEDMQRYGIPLQITELDISKKLDGIDYEGAIQKYRVGDTAEYLAIKKYEQKLQNEMMRVLRDAISERKITGITVWSISDELCADLAHGKEASVIDMKFDGSSFEFSGKDMDQVIEMTPVEMQMINQSRERFKQKEREQRVKRPVQDFSYHNHTMRCGHAQALTGIEDYIKQAIKGGIKKLAFTDHMPIPGDFNKEQNARMDMAEIDSYLEEIKYFREKYADEIEIEAGFEMEFSQRDKMGARNNGVNHFEDLKRRSEEKGLPYKMIIGQHFVVDERGKTINIGRQKDGAQLKLDDLRRYVNDIAFAMHKGIPDIVAHPDIFMQGRNEFGEAEEFMTRMICKAAIETGTTLEINFGRMVKKHNPAKPISEQRIEYPSPDFWRIVAEETEKASEDKPLKVVFGKDSHYPGQLSETRDYQIAREIIGDETLSRLYFVKDDLKTRDTEILERLGIRKLDEGPRTERKEEEVK